MTVFKLVIGFKDGKCVQKNLDENTSRSLLGKRIGDKIDGNDLGFEGYEFELKGGSDASGFPMRRDVPGIARKRILTIAGSVGVRGYYKKKREGKVFIKKIGEGVRIRKTVCGNTVNEKVSQLNLKVLKEGQQPIVHEPSEKTTK